MDTSVSLVTMPSWLMVVLAAGIPLLTAAAVKPDSANWKRVAVAAGASGLLVVAQTVIDADGVADIKDVASLFVSTFVVQVAAYAGWKQLKVNDRVLPNRGI